MVKLEIFPIKKVSVSNLEVSIETFVLSFTKRLYTLHCESAIACTNFNCIFVI